MGKWTCVCGCSMNDYEYPDENAYMVFSEILWEKISDMTDENGMIRFHDIPIQDYDMYRCPSCGGLMIFGEDEDTAKFTFYKKEK